MISPELEKELLTKAVQLVEETGVISFLWKIIKNKIRGLFKMADETTTTTTTAAVTTADIRNAAELQLLSVGINAVINHTAHEEVKSQVLSILVSSFATYLQNRFTVK